MQNVDSEALEFVTKVLRLSGASSGETDFDDAHLQQVLDVGGMIPGLGQESGWFGATQDHQHNATGTLRNTLDLYARVANPAGGLDFVNDRAKTDIWIYGGWPSSEDVAGNSIDLIVAGLVIPAVASSPFPTNDYEFIFSRTTAFTTTPLTLGGFLSAVSGWFSGLQGSPLPLPLFVPHRADGIRMMSTSTVGAGTIRARMSYLCWAGRRGHRPPGMR